MQRGIRALSLNEEGSTPLGLKRDKRDNSFANREIQRTKYMKWLRLQTRKAKDMAFSNIMLCAKVTVLPPSLSSLL